MTLTPEMVERERKAFEAWCDREEYPTARVEGGPIGGIYDDDRTHAAWYAWQEARAQPQRAVGVEELKKAVAEMEATRHIPTLDASKAWEEGYAAALDIYSESMRALIEGAGGGV